ncbi:MAG: lysophospholipase L1-like esterase [Psychromonas sp.]|jgi:lysophospholipase L1-like esterase
MNKFRPVHVLAFTLGISAFLIGLSFVSPKEGWQVAGIKLDFMTSENLFFPKKKIKKDITDLVADVDIEIADEYEPINHKNNSDDKMGAPIKINYKINASTTVFLTEKSQIQLADFFNKLKNLASEKGKMRVLHFGDSQIEGDRMTSFIRQRMQEQFGGNGPGLIPANNVYPTISYYQTFSENFKRYTCFGGDKLESKKYGLINSVARFSLEKSDSTDTVVKKAWIDIKPSDKIYSMARQYKIVKMHYNSATVPCYLRVFKSGTLIHEEPLKVDSLAHTISLVFNETPPELRFEFEGVKSPNISSFSLEGDYGLQVDNIGMRGSSGTFMGKINRPLFAKMLRDEKVGMIIMQFGGNSMPNLMDSINVRNYASYIRGQLRTIQNLAPGIPIVFIGPSDMSMLNDGVYETYPLLPYCVDELKNAILSIGASYWDLYNAMGGYNSMPAWVEKGMAGVDHIHFSNKGASVAAQLFYDAFMGVYTKIESK